MKSKKLIRIYRTAWAQEQKIVLQKVSNPSVVETFCIAFDEATGKRKTEFDLNYYDADLHFAGEAEIKNNRLTIKA